MFLLILRLFLTPLTLYCLTLLPVMPSSPPVLFLFTISLFHFSVPLSRPPPLSLFLTSQYPFLLLLSFYSFLSCFSLLSTPLFSSFSSLSPSSLPLILRSACLPFFNLSPPYPALSFFPILFPSLPSRHHFLLPSPSLLHTSLHVSSLPSFLISPHPFSVSSPALSSLLLPILSLPQLSVSPILLLLFPYPVPSSSFSTPPSLFLPSVFLPFLFLLHLTSPLSSFSFPCLLP